MIYSLQGTVAELAPTYAVVDVGGVAYLAGISLQTSARLVAGQKALLYTRQIFREDAQLLYGFHTREEREFFNLLISVSGVGPASALIMLSSLTLQEAGSAISSGNSALLQKVKGIGAKTAERIIIDLRDKVGAVEPGGENNAAFGNNKIKDEALSALEVLGIPRKTADKLAERFLKQDPELSVEGLVKQILKNI